MRKLDVFTLVRDSLANVRLPPPFTDFYRYLLSSKMNEGIVTRCVLLLNCMLGIAELTVVWGGVDEADLVGLPADTISRITQSVGSSGSQGASDMEGSSYGLGSGAANRYVAFKHGIRTAGVIDTLTAFAMQDNPIAPLRSAISGFQDHLFRPLGTLFTENDGQMICTKYFFRYVDIRGLGLQEACTRQITGTYLVGSFPRFYVPWSSC